MTMPCIEANLGLLRKNTQTILDACHRQGIQLAAVTKAVCADATIVHTLVDANADMLADARLENLQRLPTSLPRLSLRISDAQEAEEVVANSEYSLQSGVEAIRALGMAAKGKGRKHKVILMIDLGDLREGIHYHQEDNVLLAAKAVLERDGLELAGVGTNLTCFGGILPDMRNMGILLRIKEMLEDRLGVRLPLVSGGNSSSLGLLLEGRLPHGINHLRIGEGLLLGMDTSTGKPLQPLSQAVFTVQARLVEVAVKPSMPEGQTGPNAFGEQTTFEDRGEMRRGILAIGRQDIDHEGLAPLDEGVRVIGASSDHLLVDLTQAPTFGVGDVLRFAPSYGSLLRAYTSPYVQKIYS